MQGSSIFWLLSITKARSSDGEYLHCLFLYKHCLFLYKHCLFLYFQIIPLIWKLKAGTLTASECLWVRNVPTVEWGLLLQGLSQG